MSKNDADDRIFNAADSCSTDDLRGPIREELGRRDAAWARLVRAECDVAMENAPCPSAETLAERDGARQALRDLGVNVDALLGDAPGEPRPSTAGRIELHAKEYKGRLRGILVDASETRAYLGGLADAAVIARGGRARLPEGDP